MGFVLISSPAFSARIELPLADVEKISLWVGSAQVRFLQGDQKMLIVQGLYENSSESHYVAEKKDKQIQIRLKDWPTDFAAYGNEFLMKEKKIEQLPVITLIHPVGVPIELSLLRGSVDIQGWKGKKDINIIEGRLNLVKTIGDLKLLGQNLEFKGSELKGNYEVFVYNGKGSLNQFSGDLSWNQSVGFLNLSQCEGRVSLEGYETQYKMQESHAQIKFKIEKGGFQLSESSGSLEGNSKEGTVVLSESKSSQGLDVQITTQSAAVKMVSKELSKKKLRLKTQKGELILPLGFKVQRGLLEKSFRQDPETESDPGRIVIHSVDGSISLK